MLPTAALTLSYWLDLRAARLVGTWMNFTGSWPKTIFLAGSVGVRCTIIIECGLRDIPAHPAHMASSLCEVSRKYVNTGGVPPTCRLTTPAQVVNITLYVCQSIVEERDLRAPS
jgi:hypothetical protein